MQYVYALLLEPQQSDLLGLFDTVLDASKWLTENIEEGKHSKNGIFLLSEETLEEEYGIYIEADIPENGYMPIEREEA